MSKKKNAKTCVEKQQPDYVVYVLKCVWLNNKNNIMMMMIIIIIIIIIIR